MKPAPLVLATTLGLGLASALSGCGGDSPSSTPTGPETTLVSTRPVGTVQGRLLVIGGPEANDASPLAGKLTIKGVDGSTVSHDIGTDGRFAIQLSPGRYRLSATSEVYQDGKVDCVTEQAVTVLVQDQTVEADVICPAR